MVAEGACGGGVDRQRGRHREPHRHNHNLPPAHDSSSQVIYARTELSRVEQLAAKFPLPAELEHRVCAKLPRYGDASSRDKHDNCYVTSCLSRCIECTRFLKLRGESVRPEGNSQGCIFGRAGLFANQSTAGTHARYFRWTFRHIFLNLLTCSAF